MGTTLFTPLTIVCLITSLILGTYLLQLSTRILATLPNVSWMNSALICVLSSGINFLICYFIGIEHLLGDMFEAILINLIILILVYLTIGKIILKCTWLQSLKATLIWVIVYAVVLSEIFSNFNNNI